MRLIFGKLPIFIDGIYLIFEFQLMAPTLSSVFLNLTKLRITQSFLIFLALLTVITPFSEHNKERKENKSRKKINIKLRRLVISSGRKNLLIKCFFPLLWNNLIAKKKQNKNENKNEYKSSSKCPWIFLNHHQNLAKYWP